MSPEVLFREVVEAGSLKRAGENLGIEASSMSRRIAALEARLGVKLLHRSTRRTRATEAGERYYAGVVRLLEEQTALEEEISGSAGAMRGPLRVGAPVDFGSQFVVPAVRQLLGEAPEMTIELVLGSSFANLAEQGIDVAVRIGQLADSTLVAHPLGSVRRVLAASVGYLAGRGRPTRMEDLAAHDFILYSPAQRQSDILFANGERFPHARVRSRITVNSVTAIRQLVLDGVGMHWGPHWMFRDLIEQGLLERVLPDCPMAAFPVHALVPSRSYTPFRARRFIEVLRAEVTSRLASTTAPEDPSR